MLCLGYGGCHQCCLRIHSLGNGTEWEDINAKGQVILILGYMYCKVQCPNKNSKFSTSRERGTLSHLFKMADSIDYTHISVNIHAKRIICTTETNLEFFLFDFFHNSRRHRYRDNARSRIPKIYILPATNSNISSLEFLFYYLITVE